MLRAWDLPCCGVFVVRPEANLPLRPCACNGFDLTRSASRCSGGGLRINAAGALTVPLPVHVYHHGPATLTGKDRLYCWVSGWNSCFP